MLFLGADMGRVVEDGVHVRFPGKAGASRRRCSFPVVWHTSRRAVFSDRNNGRPTCALVPCGFPSYYVSGTRQGGRAHVLPHRPSASQASLIQRCAYPTNNSQPLALHLISPVVQSRSSHCSSNPTNRQEAADLLLYILHRAHWQRFALPCGDGMTDGVRCVLRPPVLFGSNMPGRLHAYWAG